MISLLDEGCDPPKHPKYLIPQPAEIHVAFRQWCISGGRRTDVLHVVLDASRRCEKSKRECGGYKPEWGPVVHHDDQGGTRPKVPISRHRTGSTSSYISGQSSSSSSSSSEPQYTSRLTPPRSPTTPLTEQAACLFAANFILLPHNINTSFSASGVDTSHSQQGFLSYLAPLLQTSAQDSPLRSAFTACSLALLSNLEKSSNLNLKTLTLKMHTLALGRTHLALKDAKTAEQNSTLATVLLLSLFESITAVKETEMLLWKTHITGAIQLVKSRGKDNLRGSKIGRVLFHAVRQHIISLSLSHGQGPPLGVDFWMDGVEEDEIGGLMATSQRLVLRTAEIRAQVSRTMERVTALKRESPGRSLWGQEIEEITELLARVRLLDREIAQFLSRVPPSQTLTWIGEVGDPRFSGNLQESEVYPGRVDVYPDVMTAGLWNTARVSRLILASSNIRLMAWLSKHSSGGGEGGGGDYCDMPEYIVVRQICEGVIADIIASVPVLLGWRPPPRPAGSTYRHVEFPESRALRELGSDDVLRRVMGQSGVGFACGSDGFFEGSNIKSLAGFFLTWPLVSIKNIDFCSPTQREWVTARLDCIARQAGLRHAGVINQLEMHGWLEAYMAGEPSKEP
ncbi:hypothetical protein V8F06_003739 [Rhypophila decipiens]